MVDNFRGHSQTTWTERHTYMVGEMSTNVHVGYIDGLPNVHVDMIFFFIFGHFTTTNDP